MRVLSIFVALLSILGSSPADAPCVSEMSFQQARLGHELEVMALTANAATLIRSGKTEKAVRLLEQRLTSAVSEASELTNGGVILPADTPNLRAAPGRAAKYASENNLPKVAAQAKEIAKKLE